MAEGAKPGPSAGLSGIDPNNLTDGQRQRIIAALSLSIFVIGIAIGGTIPWIALSLERVGTDEVTIGIVVAAQSLGIMAVAPLAYRIATRVGLGRSMILFNLLMLPGLVLLPFTDSTLAWIILRLSSGLSLALPWVLGETWINLVTKPAWRARATAIYGAAIAGGFAIGPLVLTLFESNLDLAIAAFGGLSLIGLVPLLWVLRFAPTIRPEPTQAFFSIIFTMPVVFCAVALAAVADMSFATFMPIWGLEQGQSLFMSLVLVTTLMLGNVILQFPLGLLGDRIGLRQTMRLCGLISLAGPFLIVLVSGNLIALLLVLFVFGGGVWALYSLALADLGHRLSGSALAAANGAVVFVYTASNVVGPPLAGAGLRLWSPNGFMLVTVAVTILFVALVYLRPDPATKSSTS